MDREWRYTATRYRFHSNIENKSVLIVFNKADKKTDSDINDIVQSSKEILKSTGINVYDVITFLL